MREDKPCDKCIDEPEIYNWALLPLTESYKYNWHVHKDESGDYITFKEPGTI